jgi:enoyl-CoA hydratase
MDLAMDVIFRQEQSIAYVTINREESLNALNKNVLKSLEEIFFALERSRDVTTVVITGAGKKAFVAGADLLEIKDAGEGRPELIEDGKRILARIGSSEKVVVAAVNGYALGGGCELALFCDIRIASENARFGFPEAKLGLMPGYGGTQLLPRLIGPGRAKYLMFSGDIVTAAEAYQLGLVDKVCPLEKLSEEVENLAKRISANGPFALRSIKNAVNRGLELPLPDALRLESQEYRKVAGSDDAEAGIDAFLGKKAPVFQGK